MNYIMYLQWIIPLILLKLKLAHVLNRLNL